MPLDFWSIYWTFVAFVFGAIVGSFLNVCIWRLPRGESLGDPPSHCPACQHRLRIYPDMVPLLSQLRTRSRCRYCGQPFSWRYFWVELFTAVIFAGVYARVVIFGTAQLSEEARTLSAVATMIFCAALIVIFFIDLEHYQIPDLAIAVALLAAVGKDVVLIAAGTRHLWQHVPGTPWSLPVPASIVAALVAFWVLWQFAALATAALSKEAMGAGDSLLLAAMGAMLLPWPLLIVAFLVAVTLGTVGGVAGMWMAGAFHPPASDTPPDSPLEAASALMASEAATGNMPPLPEAETAPVPDSEAMTGHRGAADLQPADGPAVPALPPSSRWGRLWTVAGSWVAVAAAWGGAVVGARQPALGVGVALVGLGAGAALIRYGSRLWVSGDREWLPAMDELFEGDPGPRFIPFGPYLVVGTFAAMFIGRMVVEMYATGSLGIAPDVLAGMGWD
jgi:leader peptidase (prepilin peptidase)/N-methyltransferase